MLGRFTGAELFDTRTVDFAAPTSIQYRPFNLNRPLESVNISLRFRCKVTVGAYTAVAAEAMQNILQKIRLEGQHRTHGSLILQNVTGASAFVDPQLVQRDTGNLQMLSVGAGALTLSNRPGQPNVSTFAGTVNDHDVILNFNIPMTPQMGVGSELKRWSSAFLLMPNDWQDTLTLTLDFGDKSALGNSTGATVAFTSYGANTGLPSVSVSLCYSLLGPFEASAKAGICLRSERPLTGFTGLASQTRLLSLDKRITTGVRLKSGIKETTLQSSGVTTFASLSSLLLNRTQIIVDSKPVRNIVDDLVEKSRVCRMFNVPPVEGYHMLSFVDGQNPLLAYRADGLAGGSQYDLYTDVITANANTLLMVMQEQVIGGPFPALRPA